MHTSLSSSKQRGFTFIEIMVVITIMGILVSLSVMLLGGSAIRDDVRKEARRLATALQLSQEEAILRGIDVGVSLNRDGYQYLLFSQGRWSPLTDDSLFKPKNWEERDYLELVFVMDDFMAAYGQQEEESLFEPSEEEDEEIPVPEIMLLSSGEVTPFIIALNGIDELDEAFHYQIKGDLSGKVTLTGPFKDLAFDLKIEYEEDKP
jgi:general secretion pathway protein H